jgi:uncharacterized protein (DUF433 family)
VVHEFLTIDLAPLVKSAGERHGRLIAARDLVESSPELLGGTPVTRGTRVPIHSVAASLAAGIPIERILRAYPRVCSIVRKSTTETLTLWGASYGALRSAR